MEHLTYRPALALSEEIAAGQLTATALMRATLDRIAAVNGPLNAIVSLRDRDVLMAEAAAADAAPRKGWLHGIPMAIKDTANAAGLPTSKGSPILAGQIAEKDDIPVARLRAAGAIFIGKTNVPEFGFGSHTFNPVFGTTRNPYAPDRSAGGSSGGAAVALATGMVSVADGSDVMGSLRNPAAWNNVYGMRPTWGLVPSEPHGETFLHQLATNGPMARTPRDLAALLDTMAGPDPRQPHGIAQSPALPQVGGGVDGLRLGWLGDWSGAYPMEEGILALCRAALGQMQSLGVDVEELDAPFAAEAIWDSWITLRSWMIACDKESLYEDPDLRVRIKETAIWEIERGRGLSGTQLHMASLTRSQWFTAAARLFDDYDVLALPAAQMWPFDADLDYPRDIAGHSADTYHRWMEVVVPASLLGLPAVCVPVGFGGPEDLPMGLQLIGRRGADAMLLRLAQAWHQATAWPERRRPQL